MINKTKIFIVYILLLVLTACVAERQGPKSNPADGKIVCWKCSKCGRTYATDAGYVLGGADCAPGGIRDGLRPHKWEGITCKPGETYYVLGKTGNRNVTIPK